MPASESPEYRRLSDELAVAQADLTRQLERRRHSHRKPGRSRDGAGLWVVGWILVPVVLVLVVVLGATEIGPALAAAHGSGTAGYFVAESESCNRGSCGWSGEFVTADGRVTLRNVSFMGPHGPFYRGATVAALDTGGRGDVYARRGSRDWIVDLAAIVIGAAGFALWAWALPYRTARDRRAGRVLDR